MVCHSCIDGILYIPIVILWTVSAYLIKEGKPHWITSIPATFLTFICFSYFMVAPYISGGLHLTPVIGYITGGVIALAAFVFCLVKARNLKVRK